MAVVAALAFFASLLLHELGHAVQARRESIEIDGITLWLFGGVARFKGEFPSAGAELRIALAGPAVSLVLGVSFVAAGVGLDGGAAGAVAAWLGYINLMLLGFNMLPALPLDGGRVFRALLWLRYRDFRRATATAAAVGRAFGFAMIALGVIAFGFLGAWGGAWIAFLGWFLLQAAAAEGRFALLKEALGDLLVRDVMITTPETVEASATLADFMDDVAHMHHYTTYPVVSGSTVVGLLPFAALARVPRGAWERTVVAEAMVPLTDAILVRAEEPLLEAVAELQAGPLDRALVRSDGQVVGLLSISDVGRLVAGA
jgi:Zn-dependent protease